MIYMVAAAASLIGCADPSWRPQTAGLTSAEQRSSPPQVSKDRTVRPLGPNPNVRKPQNDALVRAIASKDDRRILLALDTELQQNPHQPVLRLMQARALRRLGRMDGAKTAYTMVLRPNSGSQSSFVGDAMLVDEFLEFGVQIQDQTVINRCLAWAAQILGSRTDLPAKKSASVDETRAVLAYAAYLEASNREDELTAQSLIKKAADLDPTVALYHLRIATDLLQRGRTRAQHKNVNGASRAWKGGLVEVNRARAASLRTKQDEAQLDSILYDLQTDIKLAESGFFSK
jgi:hypothetical protein